MSELAEYLSRPGRVTVAGAPEGYDALLLARAAGAAGRTILHVCRDDARLARMTAALTFFVSDLPVLSFPAWDCLPYDRVSPNGELVAHRLATLTRLAMPPAGPLVLCTTVSAVLQRVPSRDVFRGGALYARSGEVLDQKKLFAFLADNGYRRAATVREPGEYAVRGGIIDVFPPGVAGPSRLDFFGDELESIRTFDAMTQRTTGEATTLAFLPVSEVMLDEASIARFRSRYREMFGVPGANDLVFEAVSSGQRHVGIEHWLPLFHERMETLFDYLPDAAVTLDHQVDIAVEARTDLIAEYYAARLERVPANQRYADADGSPVYQPVPPETLFLDRGAWAARLDGRAVGAFSPFAAPEAASDTFDANGRPPPDFAEHRAHPELSPFDALRDLIAAERNHPVLVVAQSEGSRDRLGTLMSEHGVEAWKPIDSWSGVEELQRDISGLVVVDMEHGFRAPDALILTEQDILGERLVRPPRRRRRAGEFISEISSLSQGDLVVHVEHGIGRYGGLETLTVAGAPHDCLRILYAGDDRLFLPVENIEVLSRYGSEDSGVQLDRLGAPAWQARKAKVKERIREIADQLLKVAAERATRRGETMVPPTGAYETFCGRFAWSETEDQQQAIDDVIDDLGAGVSMDRLVCGDVGFGKTEVALRAAFSAAMNGYQVAVVVPTTLLTAQHYRTFVERFAGLPVHVEQLSRLVSGSRADAVRDGLADGSVNIVVGTQALLSKRISFDNLGLLIVDEEQHFGVAQKERLKQLKANVHVLTLTATPIPRTLQMALAGVRDMSIIATPPVDRLAVRTFVMPYDPVVIREAIQREIFRGGEVFYVCPRVADLAHVHERLNKLIPDLKIAVAHGGMPGRELEDVMAGFAEGRYQVLLSTNIVEAGLDIPTANTMVVHRADRFGLAQLYQLRGRIGRSKTRAYAYLTLPPGQKLTEAAQKRLNVMQALDTLGAGFTLASHDLDIRGAGNLLGEEQSGHVKEVGVELYQQLLEEAVARQRDGEAAAPEVAAREWSPQIAIGMSVLIPEKYVADLSVRLGLYRRLSVLETRQDIDAFAAELIDRFGPLPDEVKNLLEIIEIKQYCRRAGIEKIEAGPKGAAIAFRNNEFARPEALIGYIQREARSIRLRPDMSLVCRRNWDTQGLRLEGVHELVRTIAGLAEG